MESVVLFSGVGVPMLDICLLYLALIGQANVSLGIFTPLRGDCGLIYHSLSVTWPWYGAMVLFRLLAIAPGWGFGLSFIFCHQDFLIVFRDVAVATHIW